MDASEDHLGDGMLGTEDNEIIGVEVGSFVSRCSEGEAILFIDDEAREFCCFEHVLGLCHH